MKKLNKLSAALLLVAMIFSMFANYANAEDLVIDNNKKATLTIHKYEVQDLTEYTNTELKYKYGVSNLNLLTEYDTNYNELITLLHNYGSIFAKEKYESQALFILEYAISIGTDISGTYLLLADIYQKNGQYDKIQWLKKEAEKISTSRKDSIVRKLQEFA